MQTPSKINLFSKSLWLELEQQLEQIDETNNSITYAQQAITKLILIIDQLKDYTIKYKFKNKTEETEFFREIKPALISKLLYYTKIHEIEAHKPVGSKKAMRKYYRGEIDKLKAYYDNNREFYLYYRTGKCHLDRYYFCRNQHDSSIYIESKYFQMDSSFSTLHDSKVAQIIANDLIKIFLEEEIEKIKKKPMQNQQPVPRCKNQQWTGSKAALIELIYALHTEGVFNNGTSGLKEITTFFESIFNISLGQFHRTFLEIRNRKSDRTKFLASLQEKLIIRMEEADEN